MTPKRLYRSKTNRIFGGVCGGLGEYLQVDPVMLRLIWVLITLVSGFFPGLIGYIIAVMIIPEEAPKVHEHPPKAEPRPETPPAE
jgi:phage shock protein C